MGSLGTRQLWWIAGPTVAALLIGCVSWIGPGPGLFFWAAAAALMYFVITPAIQLGLVRSSKFKGRHAAAGSLALSGVTVCAVVLWVSGMFAFW